MPNNRRHWDHRLQKLADLLKGIGPYIVVVMIAVGYMNDLHGLYGNYIKQNRAEDGLELLNSGVSIQHVKAVFGSPILERLNDDGSLSEYIYSFKRFYLQIVFDNRNEVIFFAVTSKDEDFHPKIPYLGGHLGETFAEISDSYNENEANISSKFFEYNESVYLANPGNYRNLYLAYNPAGVDYGNTAPLPFEEIPNPTRETSEAFRATSRPNTYGVGKILGGRDEKETEFGVGIEYFVSRDLPEHQY